MENWMVNKLASGISENVKRVRKIRGCANRIERTDLAMRYAVACAKDAKVKATKDELWKVVYVALGEIERSV